MGPLILWLVLAAVAVGLPLLALRADRRAAGRTHDDEDAWAFRRRVGLSVVEMETVDEAVRRGVDVGDPVLRPLAAERAAILLGQEGWHPSPRRRRQVGIAAVVALLGIGTWLVLDPPHDPALPLVIAVLNPLVQITVRRVRLQRLRRAVTSNGGALVTSP